MRFTTPLLEVRLPEIPFVTMQAAQADAPLQNSIRHANDRLGVAPPHTGSVHTRIEIDKNADTGVGPLIHAANIVHEH